MGRDAERVKQPDLFERSRARFFLGIHEPAWMSRTTVPLFVSRNRLARRKRLPVAAGPWALDSGGFTEIGAHGRWTVSAKTYAEDVARYATDIGRMEWAAPQDWMCEPIMLKRTGLTVAAHQLNTLDNFQELRSLNPALPFVPVLQGWTLDDYRRHLDAYDTAGIIARDLPTFGLGSVCRRQGTDDAVKIVRGILAHAPGIRLHGFGFKTRGLAKLEHELASADSLAWSYRARRAPPPTDHEHPRGGKGCSNCLTFALRWREKMLDH